VPDDEGNPHTRHFLGNRHCLLWIAGVVADLQLELLAEHAAPCIDVGDREIGAVLELLAEARLRSGHRPDDSNTDILGHRGAGQCQAGAKRKEISWQRKRHHILLGGLGASMHRY